MAGVEIVDGQEVAFEPPVPDEKRGSLHCPKCSTWVGRIPPKPKAPPQPPLPEVKEVTMADVAAEVETEMHGTAEEVEAELHGGGAETEVPTAEELADVEASEEENAEARSDEDAPSA